MEVESWSITNQMVTSDDLSDTERSVEMDEPNPTNSYIPNSPFGRILQMGHQFAHLGLGSIDRLFVGKSSSQPILSSHGSDLRTNARHGFGGRKGLRDHLFGARYSFTKIL